MKRFIISLLAIFFLFACEQNSYELHDQRFKYEGEPFTIRIHRFKTEEQLQNAIKGLQKGSVSDTIGYAIMSVNPKNGKVYECDIFVPISDKGPDDPALLTWGHELKHCIKGSYHK